MAKSANIKAANEKKRKLSSLQKQQKQKANKKRKIDQKRQNIENNNSHVNNTEDDYLITEEDEQFVSQNLGSLGFLQSIDEDELTISREAKNRTTKPKKKKVKEEDENKEEEYERVTRTSESWDKTTVIDKLPTKDVSSGKLVTFAPTPSIQLIQTKERLKEKEIRKEFEEKAEKDKLEKEKKTAPSKQALTAMSSIKKDIDDVGGKLPQFLYETMRKRDITAIELMVYMKQQKEYIATIAGQIIQDPESNYKKLHDLHILCEFNPSTYHLKTPKKKKNKEKYRKSKKFAHKKKGDHTTNDGDNDNDDDKNDVNEENDQTQHVEEDEDDKVNSNFIKTHSKARQLAVLSLAALYSDILPGYRIRQDSEDLSNTRQQLKKDVLKLRQYEVSLLAAYQRYLMLLERFIQEATPSLYLPSIKSYAQIIIAKPHFNFRTSILKVLIPLMAAHDDRVAKICCATFESLFENDDSGDVSLESTKMISQFLKKRSYNVRSEVLQTFLKLRFTEDLSDHLKGGLSGNHLTKKQKKKMTKSQLKAKKEKDELDKELREAEAQESKENIRYNQSEILKTIFLVYFRIIKKVQNSPLVPSVLSGLAQFAHLINLDFQADLMKSIKELMNHPDTSLDIIARCTNTVFTNIKLHGGSTLDIDLKDFYEYLYQRLFDLPHNHSSLLLVLNCIKLMITENRDVLLSRAAAFVKRLATVSLQLPPYCILAVLTCFQRIFHFHPRMNRIIESNDDKAGTDVYLPLANNPDHANGLSSTLWELSLLEQHYHATVSERSVAVSEGKATRLQPDEIFHQFDSRSGGFNPPITKPSLHPHHKQLQKHPNHKIYIKAPYSSEFYQDLVDSLDSSPSSSEISFLNNNTHFSN